MPNFLCYNVNLKLTGFLFKRNILHKCLTQKVEKYFKKETKKDYNKILS